MVQTRRRLLALDDDSVMLDVIDRYFTARGFEVDATDDPNHALDLIRRRLSDLLLLDVDMPVRDGFSLCREIRGFSSIPIIMLTGLGREDDKVMGLDIGADDYVTKPCRNRELEARVKSLLRRADAEARKQRRCAIPQVRYEFEGWTLDSRRCELRAPDRRLVSLSGSEYRLLKVLVENDNRILSRDELMQQTRGRRSLPDDRAIDVQIGRLRRKLSQGGRKCSLIKTFRGAGYMFAAPVRVGRGMLC